MLLCVDIGNTNIKLGVYRGDALVTRWRIFTDPAKLADEYGVMLLSLFASENILKEEINGCVISSVVPDLTIAFSELVRRHLNIEPVIVGNVKHPVIHVNAGNPKEVGPDLIANAVGAISMFGAPVIIIGFGTATTFTAVSAGAMLEGVAIAPGVGTGAQSLFNAGAMLPNVELAAPEFAIGKNTILSLQSGVVYGAAGMVEGLVARMKKELGGDVKVVATGGWANLISQHVTCINAVEPELTLLGLRIIYERNK
jgi:type III pantothenate kinase